MQIFNLQLSLRLCSVQATFNPSFRKGQLLVELLIAIGLSSIILPALLTAFVTSREGKVQEAKRVGAVAILREATDATRSVKNKADNWVNFAVNGTYHHALSGSAWSLVVGSETVGDFTRQIVISDVYRDSSGNIVSSGTVDPSTKKVIITISWSQPHASSISSTLYLSRYSTEVFIDTTVADFDAGVHTGTTVTNNSGGEVTLGGGGTGSWCAPDLTITALDLPKSGVANAITAIEGQAFAGTGENSSGVSFANVTIANSTPPTASVVGTFDGYKTNGIFGESGYAYLATDNNSKEIVIIDLNQVVNGKYVEAGYLNAPGNGNGNSIWVSGNTGYMTTGSKLYNFDLTSKSGSRPVIDADGVTLAGTGNKIYVVGSYVYVATSSSSSPFQIISAANPNNLAVVGNLASGLNDQGARDVFVNDQGTRAYVATSVSSSGREFFIINTSTKTAPVAISGGSYEANGMDPKGVKVVTDNKAILVGGGAEEYQVIDIATESSLSRCGGLNIDSGVNGVSSVIEQDGEAYSYIITGDATSEFKIIKGGPGGQFSTTGDFESQTFNAGIQVGFNYFSFTINEPSGSDLKFQVAINNDNATWNYIGPDGTSNTFFEAAGTIPLNQISGTYIRYKAFFSGNATSAPVLSDATINYSF